MTNKEQNWAILENFRTKHYKIFFNHGEQSMTKKDQIWETENEKNLAVFGYFKTINSKIVFNHGEQVTTKKERISSISPDLEEGYGTVLDQNGAWWNNFIIVLYCIVETSWRGSPPEFVLHIS